MDYVMEVLDPYEVGERLKSLPRDLTKAYGSVIERMRDKAFAGRILGWVLDAQRPMKMIELCVALSFHCEKLSFVELSRPTPQSILKTCGGLIEHNKENDLVTFSHAKAREYVMENRLETMAPHSTMALACILYCQDPNFKVVNDYDVQIEEHELPFGRYAATYWATHCKLAGRNVSVESKIFEAFNSEERCLTSIHYTGYFEYYPDGRLLPFLVHCGMAYLLMSPLPDAPFASMYSL
jgi:hypothetical protein